MKRLFSKGNDGIKMTSEASVDGRLAGGMVSAGLWQGMLAALAVWLDCGIFNIFY